MYTLRTIKQTLFALWLIALSSNCLFAQTEKSTLPHPSNRALEAEYKQMLNANYAQAKRIPKSEYKRDLMKFYKTRYETSNARLRNEHYAFDDAVTGYLNSLKEIIDEANPDYDLSPIYVNLARYSWQNAFSIGDGTVAVNLGLVLDLKNEDQLAFVLCHEFAHYLLDHSDRSFKRRFYAQNSEEFKEQLEEATNDEGLTPRNCVPF